MSGKFKVNEIATNPHIQFSFDTSNFQNRFLFWDHDANGVFNLGYACNGNHITSVTRYADYDITGLYVDGDPNGVYTAGVMFEKALIDQAYTLENCSSREFHTFYELLKGGEQKQSYDEIFAPVYIMNAMKRSLESGREEKVNRG